MIFLNLATYIGDRAQVVAVRPRHRAYAAALREAGRLIMGGPFHDDSGALFLYEAADLDEVLTIIADDPYKIEGVYIANKIAEWSVAAIDRAAMNALADRLDGTAPGFGAAP